MLSQPWAITSELWEAFDDCLSVSMDSETLESLRAECHVRFVRIHSDQILEIHY